MSHSRNRFRLLLMAALAPALLFTLGCAHRADLGASLRQARFTAPSGGPELLAVYQPWFGTREHINVGYSTMDLVVIAHQIEQAKNLGIAGFLVNWYGPRKEYMDRSYALIQQVAASTPASATAALAGGPAQDGFAVAIQYDESVDSPGHETETVTADLQYAYDRYIGPRADASRRAYLRYQGRPVIFIFPKTNQTNWDRVRQVTQSWQDPPLLIMKDTGTPYPNAFDGFYAWVNPGSKGWQANGSNWGEQYLADFYARMKSKYPDKIAVGGAWPGFNDRQAAWSQNRYMDARCGRTFEDSLRLFRRYYNEQNPLPFLLIETWNDYEEGTAIERGLNTCSGTNQGQKNAGASASPGVASVRSGGQ